MNKVINFEAANSQKQPTTSDKKCYFLKSFRMRQTLTTYFISL